MTNAVDGGPSERLAALLAKSTVGVAPTQSSSRSPSPPAPAPSTAPAGGESSLDRTPAQPHARTTAQPPAPGEASPPSPAVPAAVAGLSPTAEPTAIQPTPLGRSPLPSSSGGGAYRSAGRQLLATPLVGPVTLGRFLIGFVVVVLLLGAVMLFSGNGGGSSTPPVTVVQPQTFQGVAMPVSPVDGPSQFDSATASGFAQTETGAALAALHLTVRSDARVGPPVFEPLIQQQTIGDPSAVAAMLDNRRTEYQEWAGPRGVTDGAPVILPGAFSFIGWKVSDWAATGPVTVNLLLEDPASKKLFDLAPVVQWDPAAADYKLVATSNFGYAPQTTVAPETRSDYTPFVTN